ncbi:hypothetical protein L1987_07482 [Smallanthus sonchifolius]|uniref:Uncharacterized protein n=1 Tax=Smallanthus sonchifolius TaxID=185202 RepID=A0ACB9K0L5_9ASTR|nr:hypothetical protein L1987_07482 [Smallanthus sonchifolius]
MHMRKVSSSFLANKTGVLHGDELGQMKPLSNNSCSHVDSSGSSLGTSLQEIPPDNHERSGYRKSSSPQMVAWRQEPEWQYGLSVVPSGEDSVNTEAWWSRRVITAEYGRVQRRPAANEGRAWWLSQVRKGEMAVVMEVHVVDGDGRDGAA